MRRLLAALATAAFAAGAVPALAARAAPSAGPGCDPALPVTVYHGDGRAVRGPGTRAVGCGVATGFAGAESHITALPDGDVVFTPAVLPSGLAGTGTAPVDVDPHTQSNASPAGLAVTADEGAHWRLVRPSGATWNPTDHGDYVDPRTGRFFFEDYGPIPLAPAFGVDQEGPAHVNVSDDLVHWHHVVIRGLALPENPHFTSAPAPAGQPRPHGYPDVVYFCANTNVGFVSPVIAGRVCYDSLDGGLTWNRRSVLFSGVVPQHPVCGAHGEQYSAIDGYYPQPAADGSLYVMVVCGGSTYLARSTDEAASFPVVTVHGKPLLLPVPATSTGVSPTPQLRIGGHGEFVLVYQQGNRLLLRASGDRGRTWSRPFTVTAPGVSQLGKWAVAHRGDRIAVAYLAARGSSGRYDGFVAETPDVRPALRPGAGPLFAAVQVNPPSRPLLYGASVQGSGYVPGPGGAYLPLPPPLSNQSTGNDFIGAAIAPDGSAWGSFTQDCGPSPQSPGCQAQHDQTRGYAGRLVWG